MRGDSGEIVLVVIFVIALVTGISAGVIMKRDIDSHRKVCTECTECKE